MDNQIVQRRQLEALYDDFLYLSAVVYARHPAGSSLHIVLDDCNVEDSHLKFCGEEINKEDNDNPSWYKIVMLAILAMLAELDIETRAKFVENSLYE